MRVTLSKLLSGLLGSSLVLSAAFVSEAQAQLPAPTKAKADETPKPVPDKGPDDEKKKPLPALPEKLVAEIKGATPLNPESTVLLDVASSRIILRTDVACRDCLLEMLLVPEGNREHETILRIRSKAYVIHTGLLALGLEPGKPAEFSPAFVAASGPEIDIEAVWVDDKGELQRKPVQNWIRRNIHRYYAAPLSGPPPGLKLPYSNLRWDRFNNEILWYGPMSDAERDDLLSKWDKEEYQQVIKKFHKDSQSIPMTAKFVFVGSSMYKDEDTGEEYYQAEGGHVICTSNFGDALLDVKEESSASDGAQSYEGWTEHIPPKGTPVLLMLKAAEKKDGTAEKTPDADLPSPRK